MTVSPETLDAPLCEWCGNNTPATVELRMPEYIYKAENFPPTRLCNHHHMEASSEMVKVVVYPLRGYKPEYTILESGAEPMTGEWTIAELELAARYGAPYPVCGDLTAKKRNLPYFKALLNAQFAKESWTGHDPNGTQY